MKGDFWINRWKWYWRLPSKWVFLGLTFLLVCFPYPSRFVNHLKHWRDPNALVEPDAPAIQLMADELRPQLMDEPSAPEALKRVERYVYQKIPYAWDWETWGMADYLPTVTEAIELGREDCDGRAVVAASLLQNLGFKAQIVTDFSHVWVKTDKGEAMGPGKRKAVVATEKGLRVQWKALVELPKAFAYGTAVFPLAREIIIVMALWLTLISRGLSFWRNGAGLVVLVAGLLALRAGGDDYLNPIAWLQWGGLLLMIGSVFWFVRSGKRLAERDDAENATVSD